MPHAAVDQLNETLATLSEFEAAIHAHVNWLKAVHRVLIFGDAFDPAMMAGDAHHHCMFGRWYDIRSAIAALDSRSFTEIGVIHEKVHELAGDLLRAAGEDRRPDPEVYEAFNTYVVHLNGLLRRVESEIWAGISTKDALTGLHNRRAMEDFLGRCEKDRRANGVVALCDLDHFKRINDTYGHAAGDDLLHFTASAIQAQLREHDSAYRYGGEEFLIYLGGVDLAAGQRICDRLRQALGKLDLPVGDGRRVRVTASFGVAELRPGMCVREAVAHADQALYRAKRDGRDRVEAWREDMPPETTA